MARLTKEERTAKKASEALDKQIEAEYYKQGSGVQIPLLSIRDIFKECRAAVLAGGNLEEAVKTAIAKYREN